MKKKIFYWVIATIVCGAAVFTACSSNIDNGVTKVDGHAKKALLAAYKRMFDPFKARRDELEKDPDALEDILREGAKKARAAAAPVMEKVRRAVGL